MSSVVRTGVGLQPQAWNTLDGRPRSVIGCDIETFQPLMYEQYIRKVNCALLT